MQIFFVRHGQTGGNVAKRHQAEHTPLTDLGVGQAYRVAELVKRHEPTHLLTSNLVRAVETARIIGDACGLVPQTSPQFIELIRPADMYGHYHRSIRSLLFYAQWYFGMVGDETGVEEKGESYSALRQRFKRAQAELMTYPDDARLVVVSHAAFIGLFAAHLCREQALDPVRAVHTFKNILTMPNVHIVPVTFDRAVGSGSCGWSVGK